MDKTQEVLNNLSKFLGADRILNRDEVEKLLASIVGLFVDNKKEIIKLNSDSKTHLEKVLEKMLDKYEVFVKDIKTTKADLDEKETEMFKKAEAKVDEIKYLISEFQKIKPENGKDADINEVVSKVMEQIKLPESKELIEMSGERIIDAINETEDTEENKISWKKIKDVPEFFSTPQNNNAGMRSPTVLRQAVDLDHSTRQDGYAIVWDDATGRHKYAASGGGGGGSGTVNSGTQYRLAYYATTGTAISQASAITGSRVLVSDTNGVPTHSSVTTTVLAYLDATSSIQTQIDSKQATITGGASSIVSANLTASRVLVSDGSGKVSASSVTSTTLGYLDATSSIQTQLDAKGTFTLPSLTAGSVLFSNGTTIAQDNTNFFWDDTNNELGIGTNTPSYTLHVKGSTAGGHVLLERTTSSTNSVGGALRLRATSTGDMTDGFGVQLGFYIQDTAGTDNQIAVITATRSGADDNGILNFIANEGGTGSTAMSIGYNKNVSIGSSTITGSRLDISGTRSAANPSNVAVNLCTRSSTFTDTTSTGTVSLILGHAFYSNTFAASSATTYTDVANVYINGAPAAGTNVTITNTYALWVDSGTSRFDGNVNLNGLTASTILATDASKNIQSLSTSTYPSLTELSYVKGVTSAIQTQLNAKQGTITTGTTAQYFRGDLSLATFPTALSSFTNDSGFITDTSTNTLSNKTLTAPKFADLGYIADANGNEMIIFDTVASAVNELTLVNAATTTSPQIKASGSDTNIDINLVPKGTGIVKGTLHRFMVRLVASDTDQATGTAIGGDYRISNRAITIKAVGSYCDTAGTTGTYTIDINEAGVSILSTKITVDSTEKSSETAATAPVISDSAIAADAVITFDVDAVQTTKAKGLVVWIDYVYA